MIDSEKDRTLRCPACEHLQFFKGGMNNIADCEDCNTNQPFLYPELDVQVTLNRGDLVLLSTLLGEKFCGLLEIKVDEDMHNWVHNLLKKFDKANPVSRPLVDVSTAHPLGAFIGLISAMMNGAEIHSMSLDELKKMMREEDNVAGISLNELEEVLNKVKQ